MKKYLNISVLALSLVFVIAFISTQTAEGNKKNDHENYSTQEVQVIKKLLE